MSMGKKILIILAVLVLGGGIGGAAGWLLYGTGSRHENKAEETASSVRETAEFSVESGSGKGEGQTEDEAHADEVSDTEAAADASGSSDVYENETVPETEEPPASTPPSPQFFLEASSGNVGAGTIAYYEYSYGMLSPDEATEEAYPELCGSLSDFCSECLEEAGERGKEFIEEYRPDLEYMSMAFINRRMQVTRADSRITSVITDGYTYNGYAAHGMGVDYFGVFDSVTGKRLKLSDVCDAEACIREAVSEIFADTDPELFAREWTEDELYTYIRENIDSNNGYMFWFLTGRGLCFCFLPQVITYDMVTSQTAELLYEDHPGLFREDYLPESEAYALPLLNEATYRMDLDLDGSPENIYYTFPSGNSSDGLTLYYNDIPEDLPIAAEDAKALYFLHTEDGREYVYVFSETGEENTSSMLRIYDTQDGYLKYAGEKKNCFLYERTEKDGNLAEFRSALLTDPDYFLLSESGCGTAYCVGGGGMPVRK